MSCRTQWKKREGMILPCVLDYSSLEIAQWFSEFMEFIKMNVGKGAMIAQEEYQGPLQALIGRKSPEIRDKQFMPGTISSDELEAADIRYVPNMLLDDLPEEYASNDQRYAYLLENAYPPLEQWFLQTFENLKQQYGQIAAIVTFRECRALIDAAKKKEIPIFYYDCGTFRPPVYRATVYLDDEGFYIHAGLRQRYEAFCAQMAEEDQSLLLSSEEILGLMLERPYMQKVKLSRQPATCACGVCMQMETVNARMSGKMVRNEELIDAAEACFGDKIMIRGVPGNALEERIKERKLSIDEEQFAIDFLSKCDVVVCNISNMAYEGLLLGKQVYCKTMGLYQFKGLQSLKQPLESVPSDKVFLSYVAFGFYIPRELLYDEDYLRWRATKPVEMEIYKVNLRYLLLTRGVRENWLSLPKQERFENLMSQRGFDSNGVSKHEWNEESFFLNFETADFPSATMGFKALRSFVMLRERAGGQELWEQQIHINQLNHHYAEMQNHAERLDERLRCGRQDNAQLAESLHETRILYQTLLHSASWKLTAPFRYAKHTLKRILHRSI